MQYHHVSYEQLETFCREVFKGYHFTEEESRQITDVLLAADLSGIESHGIQRLIRYHQEITGGLVKLGAKPEVVFETPLSAVIEGNDCMGQTLGIQAMNMAIDKARQHGFGMITVRNSNHYGIAGYYAKMAVKEDMIGMCMTNTEAIMVPTFGRQAMLGTNPIAFAMPADPVPFSFDAATTVVPRGKLEVYVKRGNGLPEGWALDETGHDSTDPNRVLKNIIAKAGGGILPLGGSGELTSGYKGYGFACSARSARPSSPAAPRPTISTRRPAGPISPSALSRWTMACLAIRRQSARLWTVISRRSGIRIRQRDRSGSLFTARNPLRPGRPCLAGRCVFELRRLMKR